MCVNGGIWRLIGELRSKIGDCEWALVLGRNGIYGNVYLKKEVKE